MRLSILIFDGVTTLDAIGGYEVLSRIPGMEVEFVGERRGVVAADTRRLGLLAFRDFAEIRSTDVLYVLGGPGAVELETNPTVLDYIRKLDATSTWTMGVCNGVGLLAAAGVLKGRKAATNWFYQDRLRAHGVEFVPDRYHHEGKYVTSAGVSASIDAGLYLAKLIAGDFFARAIQLGIEYYPEPPFTERRPTDAADDVQAVVREFEQAGGAELMKLRPPFSGTFEVVRSSAG